MTLDNNVLSDSDETNVRCLRNSLHGVLNDVLKKDSAYDKTYCDNEDIYNICPALFDFRKRFSQNFIFAHVNINSFRHKYRFIRDLLIKDTADFFAIAESKIDSSFTNAQFHVPDYVMDRQDLSTSSGGLFVYVRGDIPHRRVKLSEINSDGFESLCIEVKIGNTKTLVCCLYKHPKVSNSYFKQCLSNICDKITPGSIWRYHHWRYELLPDKVQFDKRYMWRVWFNKSYKNTIHDIRALRLHFLMLFLCRMLGAMSMF